MENKTIFEWAEMFQEQVQNGASKSDIIQMLEEYESQALRIHDVSNRRELLCAFFKYFRDNGEANIGMTIEEFVDGFLSTQ